MKIKVLVTPQCSGCKIVKDYLNEMSIKYEAIDITKNPEMLQKYPPMSVPTIVINDKVEFIGAPGKDELRKVLLRSKESR